MSRPLPRWCGLFNIAALLCYISARQCLIEARPGFTLRAGLFVVFAVLGLLSKETGALIVLYVLAVEVVLLRPADLNAVTRRKLFALIGLVCVLPLALGVLYFVTHTDTLLADYSVREFSLAERLITQPGVLWFYLKLILIPDITLMSVFHDDYPIATFGLFSILQAISIAVAVFAACLIRRRFALISLGILWFLVSHAVESTVFPLEMVFEHRNYLALWGVFLPLIYYLTPIHAGGRNDRLRIACVAAVMVLLSFQTYTRTNTWSSMQLLSANTVREHPNSARAHSSYSRWLSDTGQYEEALMEVRAAERLDPRYPGYPLSALMLECALDRVSPETIPRIRQTLSNYPVNGHIAGALAWFRDTVVSGDCAAVDKHSFLYVTSGISEFLPRDKIRERRAAALGYLGMAQSMFAEKRTEAIDTFELSFHENPENLAALVFVSLLQAGGAPNVATRKDSKRA